MLCKIILKRHKCNGGGKFTAYIKAPSLDAAKKFAKTMRSSEWKKVKTKTTTAVPAGAFIGVVNSAGLFEVSDTEALNRELVNHELHHQAMRRGK